MTTMLFALAVRVVLVHGAPLLPSEAKAVAAVEKRAGAVSEADASEVAALRAYVAGTTPALPNAWRAAKAVIVIEVLAPSGEKPKRVSRGLGAIVVVRPPRAEPIYVERVDGRAEAPLMADTLADWIARAIKLAAAVSP